MTCLFAASLIWALSFGLINGRLIGLDSAFITAVRLGLALLVLWMPAAGGAARLPASLSLSQGLTLAYLGLVASGLGFFLWNVGATRVSAGELAVMNNAKIPLAMACSLLVFGERADPLRLLASLALLGAAVGLADRRPASAGIERA